ncbi:protein NO VEIN isoform X2 [Malania oleifera]|uniref:protein NO VEIN isoform X2 n=1 Tax=Malania oleifera TaxID=397392 RepID=UPI0025AE7D27|nr:protein NO VEIN isoform X2 [Malania oleifera]
MYWVHIASIQEARKIEDMTLYKCTKELKEKSDKRSRKRPLLSSQKRQLDERFSAISQRIESFSSEHEIFCGKHIRFISSSSEDDDSEEDGYVDIKDGKDVGSHCKSSLKNIKKCDKVSSCPYPSATEEMMRLGLKVEADNALSTNHSLGNCESNRRPKKKRKSESLSCTPSARTKLPKRNEIDQDLVGVDSGAGKFKELSNLNEPTLSISDDYLRIFITTWKEACREHSVVEVFERMLRFYNISEQHRKRVRSIFASYPYFGLLNVAVTSIKCGMWDSIYDAFQAIGQRATTHTVFENHSEYECIDVEPSEKDAIVITKDSAEHGCCVPVEDIVSRITAYFELDNDIPCCGKSTLEKKFIFLRKLCDCEGWLKEKFSVKEFKCLGYGEFFLFLEKYASILPSELLKCLIGDFCEKFPLEVCMLQHQLVVFLAQASNSLWENDTLSKQKISMLLQRQFPLVSFKVVEYGSLEYLLDIVREQKNKAISSCVLFSLTLLGICYGGESLAHNENEILGTNEFRTDGCSKTGITGPVTSKDAIEVLLRAPMLSDLLLWSHWDLIFAPSLGSLVEWLLNDVNIKELLCLVTKDGKVIRIDNSATVDSFLEVLLQGSSFQTALKLLSLFSLFGGIKHVPLALLKSHACLAFEVILKNSMESMEVNDSQNFLMQRKALHGEQVLNKDAIGNLGSKQRKNVDRINKATSVASSFILQCLGYLPSEFRSFAADILLSGVRSVIKDAHSAILRECKKPEERLMLHEVGLCLGIVEWIDDYHVFCSVTVTDSSISFGDSQLEAANPEFGTCSGHLEDLSDSLPYFERKIISGSTDGCKEECIEVCPSIDAVGVSGDISGTVFTKHLSGLDENKDASLVIESIRRDEFGLDPSLSNLECSMLKKQHARLGRALHCLSQELYSHDSHFLLELVQNADDNIYPENVEPTLTFILQDECIIVLNNEQGFSAQNIRALCDVGNSTKKGSAAGYIGQKGIGFKSVFRVTDAPEIHSNGFHVKFDISEGQIGFVLPTVIAPCDINLFRRLVSSDTDQVEEQNCWNTCIVLPFRSKLSEGSAMNNIVSMFSDLHPSLLLFLHRLECIKFRNMVNDSLIVIRKEIVGNGIIKVSHGKEKMNWLVVSQKLRADVIRPDVQTTEIAIAFTLNETDNADYKPHVDQQPAFAFLPLRTYGLKFILQGDFVLPTSREEVDGNSPWNQWLLSEFPALFVGAVRSFCALPCFQENPGKAVAAYMSFVPLVGEVHGFFSSLPRMIISKLRISSCLLLDGYNNNWVPPCKVLRNWNEQARSLLPNDLLHEHLGLGFLDKDIVLSDALARALGIEEYGPKILLQVMSSLCHTENGLKSMGLGWLCSWLNALYTMCSHYSGQSSLNCEMELDVINNMKKIPFIPLSDGTYGSVDEGTIWLHSDAFSNGEHGLKAFPNLCGKLRIVSPALFSAAPVDSSCMAESLVDHLTRMLHKIGVQQLTAHEIVKVHVLPAVSADRITNMDKDLMTEYLAFVMLHLQSSCTNCRVEREYIISELRNKALIITNHGYKRPVEVSIHLSKEYGNHIDINKLISATDLKWHEVDIAYLKHPVTESLSCGVVKWREFFKELGIIDFVHVVQVEKHVADMPKVMKNMIQEGHLIFPDSVVRDWESRELLDLLSQLSLNSDRERCKYLLEVCDTLWDDCFSDKVTGYCYLKSSGDVKPFKSSFISSICDIRWIASSINDELHYPKDVFYDCDTVCSILGLTAPYAVPKVRNVKLLSDIGFKTQVTVDSALGILQLWRRSGAPFKASISQMSKFYTFIWNEMTSSRQKIMREFCSGPFIFVPYTSGSQHEDVVSGMFLPPEEVYWYDLTGSKDQLEVNLQHRFIGAANSPLNKTLCNVYPGLHDFFVNECGVQEIPSFRSYLQFLLQLSSIALPSQAANAVFQIFVKLADGLKSGFASSEDTIYLKECLLKSEFTVLPTITDRWVSLHPSFGLVCWCDDEKLRKEFKNLDNIDFLYFGKLDEKEMVLEGVCILLQALGIPALSEVVIREAIYYGPADNSFKASLVNWALPYAQRYLYNVHPNKYSQLKLSGFENLCHLQIIVVEKLFYKNVIKRCNIASNKRFECSSLLQGNFLYTTRESDSHSVFMELSRLFFHGLPELHFANFLHMITTMAESGSTEDQTEFFILNSQKIPRLPDEESVWSFPSLLSPVVNAQTLLESCGSTLVNDSNPLRSNEKPRINSNWPPADWKTAPGFSYGRSNGLKTGAAIQQPSSISPKEGHDYESIVVQDMNANCTIEDDLAANLTGVNFTHMETLEQQPGDACSLTNFSTDFVFEPPVVVPDTSSPKFVQRDQLSFGTSGGKQAWLTGRLGEFVAFNYFSGTVGEKIVNWVNKDNETGLPYDIVIVDEEKSMEFIEVKATKSARKDWFNISPREWQFAVDKGESFNIAHVLLSSTNAAKVTIFKNPVKLCLQGQLQLVVMMPKQQKEISMVS